MRKSCSWLNIKWIILLIWFAVHSNYNVIPKLHLFNLMMHLDEKLLHYCSWSDWFSIILSDLSMSKVDFKMLQTLKHAKSFPSYRNQWFAITLVYYELFTLHSEGCIPLSGSQWYHGFHWCKEHGMNISSMRSCPYMTVKEQTPSL